ncbi:MAG: hypothetical protein WBD53_17530 [Xanthobacteraceae bacterium]
MAPPASLRGAKMARGMKMARNREMARSLRADRGDARNRDNMSFD